MVIRKHRHPVLLIACFLVLTPLALTLFASNRLSRQDDDLSYQAYRILKQNCFVCHGAAKMSGLDLRTGDSLSAGGDRGPVIVPSDARASRLFQFASHQQKPTMPPGKRLTEGDIATLGRWIEKGASFEGFEETAASAPDRKENNGLGAIPERPITPQERRFWAFQPPRRATLPRASHPGWGNHPIDSFLLAGMKAKGLKPSLRADRRTLIRRAYLDLLG